MKKNNHTLVRRALLAVVLVCLLALPALAATPSKDITVYPGVNIYVNDQKLNPVDEQGNPVEVFIYNGTTYLPVRAISNAFDQPIQWEGSTSSVYIGKHGEEKPSLWLSDLDYFNSSGWWVYGGTTKDNLGNEHDHSLEGYAWIRHNSVVYKLNGQYSRLTGMLYQLYYYRASSNADIVTLNIYGDGELLWSGKAGVGIEPQEFDVDLTGVLTLTIKMDVPGASEIFGEGYAAIGDVGLWQ